MITTRALANLERMKEQIPEWAREAILQNSKKIVDLVKFGQLSKGKDSYGTPLSWEKGNGYYSPYTQAYADMDNVRTPKPEGAAYNFSWSGETLDNMYLDFVDTAKSTYDIETVKYKEKLLEKEYGEIFKLTKEHNEFVNKTIIEPFIAEKMMIAMLKFG